MTGTGFAGAHHIGSLLKGRNEDRIVVDLSLPDGRTWDFAFDGMGGHVTGERVAALAAQVVRQLAARRKPPSIPEVLREIDRTIQEMPEYQTSEASRRPGAVGIGMETERAAGSGRFNVTFASVEDAEGVILSPDLEQVIGYSAERERGQTRIFRLLPIVNMVSDALGGGFDHSLSPLTVHLVKYSVAPGSVAIIGSDGLFKNFPRMDEEGEGFGGITEVIEAYGARTAVAIERALLGEVLVRIALLDQSRKEGCWGEAITRERYERAYREAWKQEPPARTWWYEGCRLMDNGTIIDPNFPENLQVVSRIFRDNVSVVVRVLGH